MTKMMKTDHPIFYTHTPCSSVGLQMYFLSFSFSFRFSFPPLNYVFLLGTYNAVGGMGSLLSMQSCLNRRYRLTLLGMIMEAMTRKIVNFVQNQDIE